MVDLLNTFGLSPAPGALEGYFSRTQAATGIAEPEFATHSFLSFFLTNENNYERALRKLEGRGGSLVAVGQVMPFVYGSRGASHVYAVDFDASVTYGFIPLMGTLMAMAPTRAEFLSLILARPIPKYDPRFLDRSLDGVALMWLFRGLSQDAALAEGIDALLADEIGRKVNVLIRERVKEVVSSSLKEFRSLIGHGTPYAGLTRLTYKDAAGRGGPLSSELEYKRHRELFSSGKMTGVVADLGGKRWRRFVDRMEEDVGAVYISNVEDWLFDDAIKSRSFGDVYPFYDNLTALPGADRALVVSALTLTHTDVSPLVDFVDRSIPLELPIFEAGSLAASFISTRIYIGNLSYATLESASPPYLSLILGEPFKESGKAIIEKAREIVGRERIPSDLFEARMTEESPEYRALSRWERKLFVKNLEHMRVLLPPKPFGDTVDATGGNPQKPGGEDDPPLKGAGRPGAGGLSKSALPAVRAAQGAGTVSSSCLTSLPR